MRRCWTEWNSGVHCAVVENCPSDPLSVRLASLMTTPNEFQYETAAVRDNFGVHDDTMEFSEAYCSKKLPDIEGDVPLLTKFLQQRLENTMLKCIAEIGWDWVEVVDYDTNTVQLNMMDHCPLNPVVHVVFRANAGAIQLQVKTHCFWTGEFDWVGRYGRRALLQVKNEFLLSYAKYGPFLQVSDVLMFLFLFCSYCAHWKLLRIVTSNEISCGRMLS